MKWFVAFVLAFAPALVSVVAQQSSSAEQQIRDQIAKHDAAAGGAPGSARQFYTMDAVTWSNAYSRPHTMDEPLDKARPDLQVAPGRHNQVSKTNPSRIIVAKGGDMAHEYSTFLLSYDDDKGHANIEGALLRAWQLQNGQWLIAAEFRRPYGRVVPGQTQKPGQ